MINWTDAEVEAYIYRDHPFEPSGWTEPVKREQHQPCGNAPKAAKVSKDELMARMFSGVGRMKYTCAFCFYEYDQTKVRVWMRAPGNKSKKTPVPCCPDCGGSGAMVGWGYGREHIKSTGSVYRHG